MDRIKITLRYIRRNPSLGIGLGILLFIIVFTVFGSFFTDSSSAYPLAVPASQPPSWKYLFGTDGQGRDLFAVAVAGTWLTIRIGLIAGITGVVVGTALGFAAAFYGGWFDWGVRLVVDVLLTVPGLLILIVIASALGDKSITIDGMALIIALLAWLGPTRTIRAQVLTMRERPYVLMSRLNGMSGLGIIFRELIPNLLPYLGASLVGATTAAIFASIGIAALGLGPQRDPTLGVTIYWVMTQNAFVRGLWWWAAVPITIVMLIFIMLYFISTGLDELANPKSSEGRVTKPVLRVEDLDVQYFTDAGVVYANNHINFDLRPGERLGLVGESGSGKSTLALAILRMIKPPGKISGGHIILDDTDLVTLSEEEMRQTRASQISMVPQGAMNSLNPVMRVKDQLLDTMVDHELGLTHTQMVKLATDALKAVELDPKVGMMYPHELSGGMKQRACIAIAIAMAPKVIIADEPTSALDVVTQRQVMQTIGRIQKEMGSAVILIGHDMGLMAQFVDRLAVMYAGRMAELGSVQDVFTDPLHPYTQLLIDSLPVLGKRGVFHGIPGITPLLRDLPPGCVFHDRCPKAMPICKEVDPAFAMHRPNHWAACHLYPNSAPNEVAGAISGAIPSGTTTP